MSLKQKKLEDLKNILKVIKDYSKIKLFRNMKEKEIYRFVNGIKNGIKLVQNKNLNIRNNLKWH